MDGNALRRAQLKAIGATRRLKPSELRELRLLNPRKIAYHERMNDVNLLEFRAAQFVRFQCADVPKFEQCWDTIFPVLHYLRNDARKEYVSLLNDVLKWLETPEHYISEASRIARCFSETIYECMLKAEQVVQENNVETLYDEIGHDVVSDGSVYNSISEPVNIPTDTSVPPVCTEGNAGLSAQKQNIDDNLSSLPTKISVYQCDCEEITNSSARQPYVLATNATANMIVAREFVCQVRPLVLGDIHRRFQSNSPSIDELIGLYSASSHAFKRSHGMECTTELLGTSAIPTALNRVDNRKFCLYLNKCNLFFRRVNGTVLNVVFDGELKVDGERVKSHAVAVFCNYDVCKLPPNCLCGVSWESGFFWFLKFGSILKLACVRFKVT